MGLLRGLRQFLSKFDSFSASQYLRYKGQAEYKTATGGFVSLTITVLFILLFVRTGMDTLNRVNVTATYQTQVQNDPQQIDFNAELSSAFMFAIQLERLTIQPGDTSKLDIYIYDQDNDNLTQLQPCTAEHFAFNDKISQYYDKYMAPKIKSIWQSEWLCIPLNLTLSLGGIQTSDIDNYFGISIDQWVDPNTLIPPGYLLNSVIVSTTINPYDTSNYISYYIQPLNQLILYSTYWAKVGILVEQYSIQTNTSILPISNLLGKGGMLTNTQNIKIVIAQNPPGTTLSLTTIKFRKGKTFTTYTRDYQRIDDFLAYVGGLISTVIGSLFIMGSYSELCYLISLEHKIYDQERQKPIDSDKFHFFIFMLMKLVNIFSCLKCLNLEQKCSLVKRYADTEEQMTQQLDVGSLLKRISLLERAITLVIDDDQFELIHMSQNLTLSQAKSQRNRFHLVQKVKKKIYDEKKEENNDNKKQRKISKQGQ